jgi:ribosomal protein S18 acetylase RimI-like enzyme
MSTGTPGRRNRRWTASRLAHPVRDLEGSLVFYRDLLGLVPRGGFTGHEGYDGAFLALPGGGELELTVGPARPRPGTDEDLLVLYLPSLADVRQVAAELAAAGVPAVPAVNPYWDRWGHTVLDPDGYRVVVAAPPRDGVVRIEPYTGERERLRPLFELAEDSRTQLDAYLGAGRVLVALAGTEIVGHLQLVDPGRPGQAEIKNMAVREDLRGLGIGARLVRAAADLATAGGATALVVATATADVGNLRFYQRQGFRMRSVDRDAFSSATGYPAGILIEGIELRDRVWLDRPVGRG